MSKYSAIAFVCYLAAFVLFFLIGMKVESPKINLLGFGLALLTLGIMIGGFKID